MNVIRNNKELVTTHEQSAEMVEFYILKHKSFAEQSMRALEVCLDRMKDDVSAFDLKKKSYFKSSNQQITALAR